MSESPRLYSLVAGEGDGFMLGLAAGDTAGGAWELGYSAITEQATVISYQLIELRRIDTRRLVAGLRELDGGEEGENVYRAEGGHFRAWLDRVAAGSAVPDDEPSLDVLARSAPVGVAFRRDPDRLVEQTLELAGLFHADSATAAAGLISAAGVAASCFAQSGRDLVTGVQESVIPALGRIANGFTRLERLDEVEPLLQRVARRAGETDGAAALEVVGGDPRDPLQVALMGLLLASPITERHHAPVEQAARAAGSRAAAYVGAMVGARVGIRAWPWAFANDTWFAEIGRRLVRGPDEVGDLPIPYAVEQHLMSGSTKGFH